jgi:hypothetical protein
MMSDLFTVYSSQRQIEATSGAARRQKMRKGCFLTASGSRESKIRYGMNIALLLLKERYDSGACDVLPMIVCEILYRPRG